MVKSKIRSYQFAARLISLSSWIVWSKTLTGGYYLTASGVANFPIGFITTSSLRWENSVDETLQGILFYLIAFYFNYLTLSV